MKGLLFDKIIYGSITISFILLVLVIFLIKETIIDPVMGLGIILFLIFLPIFFIILKMVVKGKHKAQGAKRRRRKIEKFMARKVRLRSPNQKNKANK